MSLTLPETSIFASI